MDKIRLAIVGCGTISQLNAPGYLRDNRCEVSALCDPIRQRAELRANQWGIAPKIYTAYEDVLADPTIDAVELLTPTHLHCEQILAGLEAGKHVSCQKPISTTVAEADRIAEAVGRAKTHFRITENFLFYPPIVKAKELLDSGAIGEPSLLRVHTVIGNLRNSAGQYKLEPEALAWRRDPKLNPGGLLYDDGVHKYATAMWWVGDVEKIYSMVTKTDDFRIEAPSATTWKFKGRDCLGIFDYAHADQMSIRGKYYPHDEFFEIQGSSGAIWVTRCTGEMLDMPPVMVLRGAETVGIQVPMDWIEGFNGAARNFIDGITRDEKPLMDVHFSRKVLQTALAVYESAKTDRPVDPSTMN